MVSSRRRRRLERSRQRAMQRSSQRRLRQINRKVSPGSIMRGLTKFARETGIVGKVLQGVHPAAGAVARMVGYGRRVRYLKLSRQR